MSRLYASIDADASKTSATRRGHKYLTTHTRGWDSGVRVEAYATAEGQDIFRVYATSGSNGGGVDRLVFSLEDGLPVFPTMEATA